MATAGSPPSGAHLRPRTRVELDLGIQLTELYLRDLKIFAATVTQLMGFPTDKAGALLFGYLRCFAPTSLRNASFDCGRLNSMQLTGYLLLAIGIFKNDKRTTVASAVAACSDATFFSVESAKFCLSEFALHHLGSDTILSVLFAESFPVVDGDDVDVVSLTNHELLAQQYVLYADIWFCENFQGMAFDAGIVEALPSPYGVQDIIAASCAHFSVPDKGFESLSKLTGDQVKLLADMIAFNETFAVTQERPEESFKKLITDRLRLSNDFTYDYITMTERDVGKVVKVSNISAAEEASVVAEASSSSSSSSSAAASASSSPTATVSTSGASSISAAGEALAAGVAAVAAEASSSSSSSAAAAASSSPTATVSTSGASSISAGEALAAGVAAVAVAAEASSSSSAAAAAAAASSSSSPTATVSTSGASSSMHRFLHRRDVQMKIVAVAVATELHHVEEFIIEDGKYKLVQRRIINLRKYEIRDPDGRLCILPASNRLQDDFVDCDGQHAILDRFSWLTWSSGGITIEDLRSDKILDNKNYAKTVSHLEDFARISYAVHVSAGVTITSMSFRHFCIAVRKAIPKERLFGDDASDDADTVKKREQLVARIKLILRMYSERDNDSRYSFLYQGSSYVASSTLSI